MSRWYIVKQGKADGPHDTAIVKKMMSSGGVSSSDYVFKVGDPDWKQVKDQTELVESGSASSTPAKSLESDSSALEGLPLGGNSEDQWVLLVKQAPGSKEKFAQSGPFSQKQITSKLVAGEISTADFVWKQGFKEWTRVRDLPEFKSVNPATAASEPSEKLAPLTKEEEVTAKKSFQTESIAAPQSDGTGKFELLALSDEATPVPVQAKITQASLPVKSSPAVAAPVVSTPAPSPSSASVSVSAVGPNLASTFPSGVESLSPVADGPTRVTSQAFIPTRAGGVSSSVPGVAPVSPSAAASTVNSSANPFSGVSMSSGSHNAPAASASSATGSAMEFEKTRVGRSIVPQKVPDSVATDVPRSRATSVSRTAGGSPSQETPLAPSDLAVEGIQITEENTGTFRKKWGGFKDRFPKKISMPRIPRLRGRKSSSRDEGEVPADLGDLKPRKTKTAVGIMGIVGIAIGALVYLDLFEKNVGGPGGETVRAPAAESASAPTQQMPAADTAAVAPAVQPQGQSQAENPPQPAQNQNQAPAPVAATGGVVQNQPGTPAIPQADLVAAGIQALPQGGPLKLRIVPLKLTGSQPQIAFETNAPPQTPIEVRVIGRTGQILGHLAFDKTDKLSRSPGELPVLNLESWRLSPGTYEVLARVGEVKDKHRIFIGVNDSAFQTSLTDHRKQIAFDQQEERRRIRQLARQFSAHSKNLIAGGKASSQNAKKWSKFFAAWSKETKRLKSRLPGSAPGGADDVAFPILVKEFQKQIAELEQRATELDIQIKGRKMPTRGLASLTNNGFARLADSAYRVKGR